MSWIPKYILEGGMYGGRMCPAGTLSGLMAICNTSISESVNCAKGLGGHNTTQSPYVTWQGAFGMIDDLLKDYITSHADDQFHEFLLAELPVENPEGAQFYKQTLTIWCRIKARLEHEQSGDDSVDYWYYEVGITKICRREYPTPYSAWTEVQLNDLDASMNGTYYKTGKKEVGGYWTYYTTGMKIAISPFSYNNRDYFGIGIYQETERADNGDIHGNQEFVLGVTESKLDEAFDIEFEPEKQEDPNEEPDPPGPGGGGDGGGDGDHELPDEPVPVPPLPGLGPCAISWLTLYAMTRQDINDFGTELVDPDAMQKLKQYFTDPLDAIVGITMIPVTPPARYAKTPVIHGTPDYEWSRTFLACLSQYREIDCGEVEIPPYWDSSFDFSPYTKIYIFLPFIGFKELDADDIMDCKIKVVYHVDCANGDCTAFVVRSASADSVYGYVPEQVIAQFAGNCGVQVPIGRVNHDAAVQATFRMLAAGFGAAAGAAAGMAGVADTSTLSSQQVSNQVANSSMAAVEGMKTKVERSGPLGGNSGYLGTLKPYIMRMIPRQSLPDNYKEINGYPCNKGGTLNDFSGSGLAVVEDIQLNNIPAMENERTEIMDWLRKGVLI